MPIPLEIRRQRGFRPKSFLPEHRFVAALYAIGKTREEIAEETGYSVWHISRILGMPATVTEVDRISEKISDAVVATWRQKLESAWSKRTGE